MTDLEVGVVTCHPLIFMWKQVKGIWATWRFAKSNGLPCDKWYGVYEKGSEIVLAQTGCLPGAEARAKLLVDATYDRDAHCC